MNDTKADRRPLPDALLRKAEKAHRGRLKIFLGTAPGVGKTFEMLTATRVRRRDGVGVVETRGRTETEVLTAGPQIVPCRRSAYQGYVLTETDLDAILACRAALQRTGSILAGHRVVLDRPADLPVLDMVLFEQVLLNLSGNARQTPDGSVITIAAHVSGETVVLRIMDAGDGIPRADVERIFETFYRATRDRPRVGSGPGLAICRCFIEAKGGSITGANRPDGPRTVMAMTLLLPANALQPEEESVA